MMLGDVLAAARASGAELDHWLAPEAPGLWARAEAEAARSGVPVAEIARGSVGAFTARASEEDWATLLSRLRTAADPGRACLLHMLGWRLGATTAAGRRTTEDDG